MYCNKYFFLKFKGKICSALFLLCNFFPLNSSFYAFFVCTFSFYTFFPNRGYILSKTQMWSKILDLSICEEDCWEDLHLLQQAQILGKSFVQTDSDLFSVSAPPTKICVYICACTCFGIVLISVPMYFDTCSIVDYWHGC